MNQGGSATFSVTATGTAPLGYQWQLNSTNIASATASTYTRGNLQTNDAGSYSVVVSNSAGIATSSNALLTVTQPVPPHIESITNLRNGSFQLQVSGGPGSFAIEAAPSLTNWTQLTTMTSTASVFQFTDTDTNQTTRFYRVRLIP